MIPVRVYVENFMSYRQGQELLFDGAPLWVLAGENGVGKSTIFDAITFALYNFYRGIKQNHKDLINHQEDSLAVEFDFLINDSQYRIRRTVSRRSAATRQISKIIDNKIKPISNTDNEAGFKEWIEHHLGLKENAFTSCVLLTQGNSDKLLTAKGTERFTILKQIIDLSAYEKLHEQADNLRKQSEGEYKTLTRQLEDIETVTSEQLQLAQQEFDRIKKDWQVIQERVEKLNQIIQQAKQWEQLQQQIEQEQVKKQKLQQLIERFEEITTNYNRFEELQLIIPKIQDIIIVKERLTNTQQKIQNIEQNLQSIQQNKTQLESEQKKFQEKCDCLQENLENLQSNLQQVTTKLSKIAPLIEKLGQYEKIKSNLEQCDLDLTKYPLGLIQKVENQEQYYQELIEIKNTLPWLKSIVESRSNLGNAIAQQKTSDIELQFFNSQLIIDKQDREEISHKFKSASQTERDIADKANLAKANYQGIGKQLKSFEQAITKPTCELCGQEITAEHAQQEKQRLKEKLTDIEINLNQLNEKRETEKLKLFQYQEQLEDIDNKITQTEKSIDRIQNEKKQAKTNIQRLLQELDKNWDNLLSSDRAKISSVKPNCQRQWLETMYPNSLDIEQLEQRVNTIKSEQQNLNNLRQQLEDWKQLNNQSRFYSKQLEESKANFSITEAQNAKEEYRTLDKTHQQIENSIENNKQELKQAKDYRVEIDEKLKSYLQRLQQERDTLTKNNTIYQETQANLKAILTDLPQQWQEEADCIDNAKLEDLQLESSNLIKYQEIKKQLDKAQQALDYSTQQIVSYQQSIVQLPIEAYRSSTEIENDLVTAREKRENCDRAKSDAEKKLNKLYDTKEKYARLEQEKMQAERNSSLYKTLSNLLGKDGIQTYILRNAEIAIVAIANEILDSLSRGSIRLELREDNKRKKNEALDLITYNFATGEKPTAVALTSGSQRFRIAVSLALAIGQYVGNNVRNIESVIIDEGFGSLDKNGRDNMIEELNQLKQRLKRIILVSHQEEFFNEFTNGYKIELRDKASQASLLESSF